MLGAPPPPATPMGGVPVPPPASNMTPPATTLPTQGGSAGMNAMHKAAFSVGALESIKEAARIGRTVPTSYEFQLDPDWMANLPPEVQLQAHEHSKNINAWLNKNKHLGKLHGQAPELASMMAHLGKLGKGAQQPVDDSYEAGKQAALEKLSEKLTTEAREHISSGNFALPGRRYPIEDQNHGRAALSMVAKHGTPEEKSRVRAAVHRKYPNIGADKK